MSGADPALEEGWIDRELALEFPELRIVSVVAAAPGRRTPSPLRERLALLADRFHGARALTLDDAAQALTFTMRGWRPRDRAFLRALIAARRGATAQPLPPQDPDPRETPRRR